MAQLQLQCPSSRLLVLQEQALCEYLPSLAYPKSFEQQIMSQKYQFHKMLSLIVTQYIYKNFINISINKNAQLTDITIQDKSIYYEHSTWYTSSLSVPLPFLPNITRVCIRFRCMWFGHLNANLIPGLSECRFSWAQKRQHAAFFPGMYVNLFVMVSSFSHHHLLFLNVVCFVCHLCIIVFCVSNPNIILFH